MLTKLVSALSLVQIIAGKQWFIPSKQTYVTHTCCYPGIYTCGCLAKEGGAFIFPSQICHEYLICIQKQHLEEEYALEPP